MNRTFTRVLVLMGLLVTAGIVVHSQAPMQKHEPGRYRVAIYNVSPGKHLAFLKWSAQQEAIAKEAGAAPTHWFRHLDGASWDYIAIDPVGSGAEEEALGKKTDAIAKAKGLATGAAGQLEFRALISSHTDTYAMGPMTAEEMVKEAEKKN
jgi:hypothetical protein